MRRLTAGIAAGAALAVGVLGGAAGTAALAEEVPGDGAVSERVEAIRDAIAGLVGDGTLTQQQADAVAETLGESDLRFGHGHGLHGGHVDPQVVADVLGITVEELRAAALEGRTLTEIAEEQGISRADLVDGLVTAADAELDERVEDGRLTQEQADTIREALPERIDEAVDRQLGQHRGRFGHGRHHGGPGGHGWHDRDGDEDGGTADSPTPSGTTT